MNEDSESEMITRRDGLKMAGVSGVLGLGAGAGITAGVGTLMGTFGDVGDAASDVGDAAGEAQEALDTAEEFFEGEPEEPVDGIEISGGLNWQGEHQHEDDWWSRREHGPIVFRNRTRSIAHLTYHVVGGGDDTEVEEFYRDGEEIRDGESTVYGMSDKDDLMDYEFKHPRTQREISIYFIDGIEVDWLGETIFISLPELETNYEILFQTAKRIAVFYYS